ncbi:MAG: hypothetical protein ACFFDG_12080 [Promethearchaeota archaeon]
MKLNSTILHSKKHYIVNLGLLFFLVSCIFTSNCIFTRNISSQNSQINQELEPTNFKISPKMNDTSQYYIIPQPDFLYEPYIKVQDSILNKTFFIKYNQRAFWMWDFNDWSYYKMNATLISVGENCYIYMEDYCIAEIGEYAAIKKAEDICDEFDNIIYPRIINLAGHPNGTLGDIDGDPRIIILLSSNPISYYDQRNELELEYSNLCEMFHIYYKTWIPTIAHEFHHLIWFNNEMDEPHFTLEALAEYAVFYANYLTPYNNLSPQTKLFLSHPGDSLLYWNMLNSIDYGSAYLFAFYIAEHYGLEVLRNLIMEPADGAYGIENVLYSTGNDISFNELYLNWITALTLDEIGFMNNLYGFENLDARVTNYTSVNFPLINDKVKLYYYGFHVHKISSLPNNFAVEIKKDQNTTIGFSIAFHDSMGWHVYQNLNNEGNSLINEKFIGSEIDEAYIITSYIFNQTPPIPSENGLGPFIYIEITIKNTTKKNIIPNLIFYEIFILLLIITLITLRKVMRKKTTIDRSVHS